MNRLKSLITLIFITLISFNTHAENTMNPKVKLSTSMGDIVLVLDADKAPITVENFTNYVKNGHYDGLIFHRIIPNFMVQGGGMEPGMKERLNLSPIQNEADNGLKNNKGTIAMARTNEPHSATSQFFINLKENDFLNHTGKDLRGWGYTVFGEVVEGIEVVDAMGAVATGNAGGHGDVPTEDVMLIKAEIVE
jgi:peptidyl-prolyl cis-trans isomerase B (cyclophilin B)